MSADAKSEECHAGARRWVSARTGVVALFGHPVDHSRSPAMHNACFEIQGLEVVYVAFDVAQEDLSVAIQAIRVLGMVGVNLTVPHKEAVLGLLDELDPEARRVGAVNTVVRRGRRLVGYNTDVAGFLRGLEEGWGRGPEGASCLVLGAGGAARAVVAALMGAGAAEVWVHNRTLHRAESLCRAASSWGASPCRTVDAASLAAVGRNVDLIVNTTTVGLGETVKKSPLPVDILTDSQAVMDLVYGGPTALVSEARLRGAVAFDGTGMLVHQAAYSYELWTGLRPPLDVMRRQVLRD